MKAWRLALCVEMIFFHFTPKSVAFSADIAKIYVQMELDGRDEDFRRIL